LASSALDPQVLGRLEERRISFCLIGAAALSANGFARYTADVDLLTLDTRVLVMSFWEGLVRTPEVRKGGEDDPLQGVVRWSGDLPLDLIVGRGHAARLAVDTAVVLPTFPALVATPLALTLLKLEAGSPQDRADILSLASVQRELNGAAWLAEVPLHLDQLSQAAREVWQAMQIDLANA
jgi:hypothetical protein